eukprot:303420_1
MEPAPPPEAGPSPTQAHESIPMAAHPICDLPDCNRPVLRDPSGCERVSDPARAAKCWAHLVPGTCKRPPVCYFDAQPAGPPFCRLHTCPVVGCEWSKSSTALGCLDHPAGQAPSDQDVLDAETVFAPHEVTRA